ncbi:Serine/threonine-protein kinase PrkC [Rubripirellula tenax]|uniref:Serine/threonine-protein kinase PrkC n=1 Tax=Rubripirellula tenax TaxID=2528015 RepID=A0A5C6FKG0_9BACT|nr:serine/threonine-protein kinase [Rubripirellula tenax]TWU60264.1 Serine/threonine-protein kinase PrkC [Rubripirellula tenax]
MSDAAFNDRFVNQCVALKFLTADVAREALAEASSGGMSIESLVVRRGWMTPDLVDIAESLLHPTDTVPGYELLEVLGRGGMGVVYRARQLDLDRIVAIKTILLSSMTGAHVAQRFEREAMAVARLQHPGIVQAWNYGQHNGRYFLVMEFIKGQPCDQLVRGGQRLSPVIAWNFVRQAAAGLSHAQTHGVIHRDIKPANLIVTSPPEGSSLPAGVDQLKITDFGLAILSDTGFDQARITTDNALVGSPAYMSPEQFDNGTIDFRSDIYSLGITALHLLSGQMPFAVKSLVRLAALKKSGLPDGDPLLRDLPNGQAELLRSMIAPSPDDRPASYRNLIDRIDALQLSPTPHNVDSMAETMTFDPSVTSDPTPKNLAVTQPFDSSVQPVRGQTSVQIHRRRWIYGSIAAVAVGGSLVAFAAFALRPNAPGVRQFTRTEALETLFDGITLAGWDVGGSMVGAWNVVPAPDDSTSIACLARQGAITRRLPDWPHQRITLLVYLSDEAAVAEVDFGFDAGDNDAVRSTLRVQSDLIQLGTKQGDFGDLNVQHQEPAPLSILDRFHVVHIERQGAEWYVFFEQVFVGWLPIDGNETDAGDLRLVVRGNSPDEPTIHFADVQANRLGLATTTKPSSATP